MKYAYQVQPKIPIRGVGPLGYILRPTNVDLEKDEVIKCIKCGPVFRRFDQNNMVRVIKTNIDELHVSKEEYFNKDAKKVEPEVKPVENKLNTAPELPAINGKLEKVEINPEEKPVVVDPEPESGVVITADINIDEAVPADIDSENVAVEEPVEASEEVDEDVESSEDENETESTANPNFVPHKKRRRH